MSINPCMILEPTFASRSVAAARFSSNAGVTWLTVISDRLFTPPANVEAVGYVLGGGEFFVLFLVNITYLQ